MNLFPEMFNTIARYALFCCFVSIFVAATLAWDDPSPNNTANDQFEEYSEPIPGSEQAIAMSPVPGGTFTMGSPADQQSREADEGPPHSVKVDSFWMSTYEITWDQYDLFVKEELDELKQQIQPSSEAGITADAVSLPTPPYVDMSFGMGREGYPAINMTHYAAVMFTKWLTAQTGRFYRLPTEAEWEYACRAESQTAYAFGDDSSALSEYGWYAENSSGSYHKPGQKQPNGFGLYDMHGNVAEWTMDQYHEDYFDRLEGEVAESPLFLPDELYPRSLRGGSWQHEAPDLRCANRQGSNSRWKRRDPQLPKSRWWLTDAPFLGFRIVRPADQPSKKEMEKYWINAIEDYN